MFFRMFIDKIAGKPEIAEMKRKCLSASQLFNLTIEEMRKALPGFTEIEVPLPENLAENSDFNKLDRVNANKSNSNIAHVFVNASKKIAHVVYYPGVDPGRKKVKKEDIPLSQIISAVNIEVGKLHQLAGYTIKKHISIGVCKKNLFREDHFVALAEVDGVLTVINPKGELAKGSNPSRKYVRNLLLENINKEPLAAFIQDNNDTTSCGYCVAAIHAKTANMEVTQGNFKTAMEAIKLIIKPLIASYQTENKNRISRISAENLNIGTFSMDDEDEENVESPQEEEKAREILASLQNDIITTKRRQRSPNWREVHVINKEGANIKKIAVPKAASLMLIEIRKVMENEQLATQAVRNIIKISIKPEFNRANFYQNMLKKMQIDPVASLDKIQQAIIGEKVNWHLRGGGEVIDISQKDKNGEEREFSKTVPNHARKMLKEIAKVYDDIMNHRDQEEKYYTVLSNIILIATKAASNDHFLRHKETQLFYETITNLLVIKENAQPIKKLKY